MFILRLSIFSSISRGKSKKYLPLSEVGRCKAMALLFHLATSSKSCHEPNHECYALYMTFAFVALTTKEKLPLDRNLKLSQTMPRLTLFCVSGVYPISKLNPIFISSHPYSRLSFKQKLFHKYFEKIVSCLSYRRSPSFFSEKATERESHSNKFKFFILLCWSRVRLVFEEQKFLRGS